MPVLNNSALNPIPTQGEHFLTCYEADFRRIESRFPDNKLPDGKAEALIAKFRSTTLDQDGVPEELHILMPAEMSARNKTGKVMRLLIPGLNPDAPGFNTDTLIGRQWRGIVVHETTANGKIKPTLAAATPTQFAQQQAVAPPPPQQQYSAAPPQQQYAPAPPQQQYSAAPPQQQYAPAPPQQQYAPAPPPQAPPMQPQYAPQAPPAAKLPADKSDPFGDE